MEEDWLARGEGGLYDQMLEELAQAIGQLRAIGYHVQPRAFIWIQGESDASRTNAAKYQQRLAIMIDDLRMNVLVSPQLPVILGVDEQYPDVRKFPEVVLVQKAIANDDPDIVYTSMWNLEKSDGTHLTPIGVEEHGVRIFEAHIDLTQESQPISGAVSQ